MNIVNCLSFVKQINGGWVYKNNGRITYTDVCNLAASMDALWNADSYAGFMQPSLRGNNINYINNDQIAPLYITFSKPISSTLTLKSKEKTGQYIVWSPQSDKPPASRFDTEEQAKTVAEKMARLHGTEFYYCKLVGGFKVETKVTEL